MLQEISIKGLQSPRSEVEVEQAVPRHLAKTEVEFHPMYAKLSQETLEEKVRKS